MGTRTRNLWACSTDTEAREQRTWPPLHSTRSCGSTSHCTERKATTRWMRTRTQPSHKWSGKSFLLFHLPIFPPECAHISIRFTIGQGELPVDQQQDLPDSEPDRRFLRHYRTNGVDRRSEDRGRQRRRLSRCAVQRFGCVLERASARERLCCILERSSRPDPIGVSLASGKIVRLSKDHRPEDPEEKRRIESLGGRVVTLPQVRTTHTVPHVGPLCLMNRG